MDGTAATKLAAHLIDARIQMQHGFETPAAAYYSGLVQAVVDVTNIGPADLRNWINHYVGTYGNTLNGRLTATELLAAQFILTVPADA